MLSKRLKSNSAGKVAAAGATAARSGAEKLASAAHFRVQWGGPDGSEGFARAEFSGIGVDGRGELLLSRAFTGDPALRDWLGSVRAGKGKSRTLSLHLLDALGETVGRVVLNEALPVRWSFSPLDAMGEGVVLESIAVGFGSVSVWKGG
ncbi:phage tail protein [Sandaracinobacteroides hominis]|uniref:phage tail protein n=1 Tax=Sandaracinobacteroides hominis TaxID=2780086 RepID=UPI0018F50B77|nr:phage tail protein [Sandaracinobacteroides hominis]